MKNQIVKLLEDKDFISVDDLAAELGVSEITVRRDLNLLSEKGLLIRTHGGAASLASSVEKVEFVNKALVRQEEKEHIARLAAQRIAPGDTIFLDCGSTVYAMAPFIKHLKIKVITNSLPLVHALLNSKVELNLVGGEVDIPRMAVHGAVALQHIGRYKATRCFVGVDGISFEGGLRSNSEKEAEITLAMARQSREVCLLCDSSKLEKDKYLSFAPLDMIDYLITDKNISEDLIQKYRGAGVNIIHE